MTLRFAYNTNGAANHRLDDAINLIADSGYDGVALTLDIHHLDPFAPNFPARPRRASPRRLRQLNLGCVVETGARFLLDPRAKHEPTLLTAAPEGRARRIDFLSRALRGRRRNRCRRHVLLGRRPQARRLPGASHGLAPRRRRRASPAAPNSLGATAALEPEPGMLIETPDDWAALTSPA